MPYGIQPSTIIRQLCELERQTGLCLYERRPFKLTSAGENLFAFLKPLFEDLPRLVERLRKGEPEFVRLGASPVVLRDYLPSILRLLSRDFPELRLTCNEGLQSQIEVWLKDKVIDLAVTVLEGDLPSGYLCEPLLRLPMVLLVPDGAGIRSAAELWQQDGDDRRLVRALVTLSRQQWLTERTAAARACRPSTRSSWPARSVTATRTRSPR